MTVPRMGPAALQAPPDRRGGPLGSIVIADHAVVVGVTALGRKRILVSESALGAFDAGEIQASLTHEMGHIQRRHRPMLLLASILSAMGRLLPGTRAAERGLRFSLERDADEFAVAKTRDPSRWLAPSVRRQPPQPLPGPPPSQATERSCFGLTISKGAAAGRGAHSNATFAWSRWDRCLP